MNLVIAVVGLLAVTLLYTLFVRAQDIPKPEPVSPTQHLDERKAAIYENLRDLQFEYRVGKLSDADYQQTKLLLQKELAVVIGEIAKLSGAPPAPAGARTPAIASNGPAIPAKAPATVSSGQPVTVSATASAQAFSPRPPDPNAGFICPHCGHEFPLPLKFCGECGKEMA